MGEQEARTVVYLVEAANVLWAVEHGQPVTAEQARSAREGLDTLCRWHGINPYQSNPVSMALLRQKAGLSHG